MMEFFKSFDLLLFVGGLDLLDELWIVCHVKMIGI
jgi:hypothetical protein